MRLVWAVYAIGNSELCTSLLNFDWCGSDQADGTEEHSSYSEDRRHIVRVRSVK